MNNKNAIFVLDDFFGDDKFTHDMSAREAWDCIKGLLKEQDELLHKLQKDKDKLCLEVSEWKHKYHDRPLKEQEAVKPKIDALGNPYCPECKVLVYKTWNFCPHCGGKMKQEGR